jgi:hypothetical protein
MPRRPAHITQADIARAIRALRQCGIAKVRVVAKPDGSVVIEEGGAADTSLTPKLEARARIAL